VEHVASNPRANLLNKIEQANSDVDFKQFNALTRTNINFRDHIVTYVVSKNSRDYVAGTTIKIHFRTNVRY
jgi:hypothetical protein